MSHLPSPIYLASASPRRRDLLRQIGVRFELFSMREASGRTRDIDETPRADEAGHDYVERVATEKAVAAFRHMQDRRWADYPVLAADTSVVLGDAIFGKPEGLEQAIRFLEAFSGKTHTVYTAVALCSRGEVQTAVSATQVRFRPINRAELVAYIATREPFGKAGGYAIQGLGAIFVEQIQGSYSGVMGLPLFETAQLLMRADRRVL